MKILHCPTIVGGHPPDLANLERSHGFDSVCVVLGQNEFSYPGAVIFKSTGWHRISLELRRWQLLWNAIWSYDIIHFNFGASIFPQKKTLFHHQKSWVKHLLMHVWNLYAGVLEYKDVWILKKLGKKIIVTMQGDDARLWDYCYKHFQYTHVREAEPIYIRKATDDAVRKRIKVFTKFADIIYALNPDLLRFLPPQARFFPYAHPNINQWSYVGVDVEAMRPIRIVHAPSNRVVKGTRFVEEAISKLRVEGFEIDFRLVEHLSNEAARAVYSECDLLIDQLLGGWFGGLGLECMALGKPIVCYLREEDLAFLPTEMNGDLPIINANPDTILDVLRDVLNQGKDFLKKRGDASRQFAEKYYGPEVIAQQVGADYRSLFVSK
jgi:glycosyltransferase involved in cell wall biosynthesis